MTQTSNPLDTQVGGDHYRTMKIQPVELSMKVGLDACAHSVLKYVCRHRTKNGRQDLEKARHFAELRRSLAGSSHARGMLTLIGTFIKANAIADADAAVLRHLAVAVTNKQESLVEPLHDNLIRAINDLIDAEYPVLDCPEAAPA